MDVDRNIVKDFKIVDSFLFSEPHEKELLLLKFILEDDGIDEWILIENAYSFQGEYTGLHARKILEDDPRFMPYLQKLTIISKEEKTPLLAKSQETEKEAFKAEFWQRNLVQDYFCEKYNDGDWIFISDVDEMIDFSDSGKYNEFIRHLNGSINGLVKVPTKKFWFDFDNEYLPVIANVICSKKYLLANSKKLHQVRAENRRIIRNDWKYFAAFEYSSCFCADAMVRKLETFSHTGFSYRELKQSLRCNHRPTIETPKWRLKNDAYFFFEKVKLTPYNSPTIVRDNIEFYKTNVIDPFYKINRKIDYPHLFTLSSQLTNSYFQSKKWFRKELNFLKVKLGLK